MNMGGGAERQKVSRSLVCSDLRVPEHPFPINGAKGGGSSLSISLVDAVTCFNLELDHLFSARNA